VLARLRPTAHSYLKVVLPNFGVGLLVLSFPNVPVPNLSTPKTGGELPDADVVGVGVNWFGLEPPPQPELTAVTSKNNEIFIEFIGKLTCTTFLLVELLAHMQAGYMI
jgi:hypothetical protein